MTISISFPDDFVPYRQGAAVLTQSRFDLEPGVLDAVKALDDELDERFVKPLLAAYDKIPFEQRAGLQSLDIEHQDAIWQLVDSFAGFSELGRDA